MRQKINRGTRNGKKFNNQNHNLEFYAQQYVSNESHTYDRLRNNNCLDWIISNTLISFSSLHILCLFNLHSLLTNRFRRKRLKIQEFWSNHIKCFFESYIGISNGVLLWYHWMQQHLIELHENKQLSLVTSVENNRFCCNI